MSLRARHFVRGYSVSVLESEPRRIIRSVVLYVVVIEAAGAWILHRGLAGKVEEPLFSGVFHSVSAFCNAGFSLYPDSFVGFRADPSVVLPLALLIVLGGIGFVVLADLGRRLTGERRFLSLHSRVVLISTGALLALATVAYLALERRGSLGGDPSGVRFLAAFFQSVTTRTAGFNTIDQARMSLPAKVLTLPLMLVGGSSGSAAGGIKVSTFAIILIQVFVQRDSEGEIRMLRRKISADTLDNAPLFALRALAILFACVFGLVLTEAGSGVSFLTLLFESFSAFGTVGLSLGATPSLSTAGKMVIAATMFAGRVGIISLVAHDLRPRAERAIDYPKEEVLIG
jgi:trk system potassium uptake protein TrkH